MKGNTCVRGGGQGRWEGEEGKCACARGATDGAYAVIFGKRRTYLMLVRSGSVVS